MKKKLSLPDNETMKWLSPLKCDGYAEYRDEAFLERLDVKLNKVPLNEFSVALNHLMNSELNNETVSTRNLARPCTEPFMEG